jgi:DNA polymerase IV
MELFRQNYRWEKPIRSIGVRGADLVTADSAIQLDMFERDNHDREALEHTVDVIRERFGPYSLQRCVLLKDGKLTGFNPKDDHVISPVSYFR